MLKKPFLPIVALLFGTVFTSKAQPKPTPASERNQAAERRSVLTKNDIAHLQFKNIGPTIMSGRVVDLDVNPNDPTRFFVAFASGGLWYTENNGQSFEPCFDTLPVMTIGDIAVNWSTGHVWVGTGEVNSSRSSYAGNGMYLSTNWGKSWQYKGLPESHHIGTIVMHPTDQNTLWVCVLGHLFSDNKERGLYKTTDGGNSWNPVLQIDAKTGAIDAVLDPFDANHMYCATWQRERYPWNFVEDGDGSGIWESFNGGTTWQRINNSTSGFPTGNKVGRIGLAISSITRGLLYAILDHQENRPANGKTKTQPALSLQKVKSMNAEDFLALPDSQITAFLQGYNYPSDVTVADVKSKIKSGKLTPQTLTDFLDDDNDNLFNTPVIGAALYCSKNGGKTWEKTHKNFINGLYYSYGYYFGKIFLHPTSDSELVITGVSILKSTNSGATFTNIDADNMHGDHHVVWMNPKKTGHWIVGNDGGVNITYDHGAHYQKLNNMPVGQFYAVAVDQQKPYNVYGGLQDNGVWMGPSTYTLNTGWHDSGQYPWKSIMGGDGMQVQIDPRDNKTVYTGFQFGNYYRINSDNLDYNNPVAPVNTLGKQPLRFNWQTPILLSAHQPDVFYIAAQNVYRSLNKGADLKPISPDLTLNKKPKGNVPYGTIACMAESPFVFGKLYTGSDDGKIHLSPDGGITWKDITSNLPKGWWVRKIVASAHAEARVYAVLNGHPFDNFESQLYVSQNDGKTWNRIGLDLPVEPVNVVKEDIEMPNLLYVGTDHALYISLDTGKSFFCANGQLLPNVPIHDLALATTAPDLVIATHGRSIYKANVALLRKINDEIRTKPIALFTLSDSLRATDRWGTITENGDTILPQIVIPFYTSEKGTVTVKVMQGELVVNSQNLTLNAAGVQQWQWNLMLEKQSVNSEKVSLLTPGKYTLLFTKGNDTARYELKVLQPKKNK